MTRRRAGIIAVIVVAVAGLTGLTAWAATHGPGTVGGPGPGMVYGTGPGGAGMMGGAGRPGGLGITGTGPVTDLAQARTAAQRYADRLDLRVGEVMRFSENYYAELRTADGTGATEVLVDPATGDVRIEYGPAMMWNTGYGMHASGTTPPARVSPAEARRLADRWLAGRDDGIPAGIPAGTTAGEAETFPGYYTLHTLRDGEITGMLSVNATSGAVWYHSWHGTYEGMTEG